MKIITAFAIVGCFGAALARGQTPDPAPASLGSTLFIGTLTGATGGANNAGTFTSLLTGNGTDYTLGSGGALSDPVPYTYAKESATTATLTEPAVNGLPSTTVALTFAAAGSGTFSAAYGDGTSQQGTFTLAPVSTSASLINASTRVALAANGTAITGFVIGGNSPHRVLIRAIGPGLVEFGVKDALMAPTITVWKGSQSIGANAGFDAGATPDASLPQDFSQVGAFPLQPGSKDSAIVLSLAPGSYTAEIRSASATDSGEVLLEVYVLD